MLGWSSHSTGRRQAELLSSLSAPGAGRRLDQALSLEMTAVEHGVIFQCELVMLNINYTAMLH